MMSLLLRAGTPTYESPPWLLVSRRVSAPPLGKSTRSTRFTNRIVEIMMSSGLRSWFKTIVKVCSSSR